MPPEKTLWALEPHTRGKHKVLREYLNAWFPILGMGKANQRILFIDGFAGPGVYEGGEEGSPLIALRALKEHSALGKIHAEVVYLFIEQDKERAMHLKTLVEAWKPELPDRCHVRVIQGSFDATMTDALNYLDTQAQQLAPAFVMIDPFGVRGTPMSVIERILRNPRSEVYISFMYESINRFKVTSEFMPHLDALFGCSEWRNGLGIEDSEARKDFFYGLYESQLRSAGARYVLHLDLYEGSRLVYAIFFATKHPTGCDKMKQAIWKVAPFGDFAFHGTKSGQLTLGLRAYPKTCSAG
jgi:three-Cys-motif partner protein